MYVRQVQSKMLRAASEWSEAVPLFSLCPVNVNKCRAVNTSHKAAAAQHNIIQSYHITFRRHTAGSLEPGVCPGWATAWRTACPARAPASRGCWSGGWATSGPSSPTTSRWTTSSPGSTTGPTCRRRTSSPSSRRSCPPSGPRSMVSVTVSTVWLWITTGHLPCSNVRCFNHHHLIIYL